MFKNICTELTRWWLTKIDACEKDDVEKVHLQSTDFSPVLSLTPQHPRKAQILDSEVDSEDEGHIVIDIHPPKQHVEIDVNSYYRNPLQRIQESEVEDDREEEEKSHEKEVEIVQELGYHDRSTNVVLNLPSIEQRKDRFSPSDSNSTNTNGQSPTNSLSPPNSNFLDTSTSIAASPSQGMSSLPKITKPNAKIVKSLDRGHMYLKPRKFRWDRNQLLLSFVSTQGQYWPEMRDYKKRNCESGGYSTAFRVLSNMNSPGAIACA